MTKISFLVLIASMSSTGCAFFNTFYMARKAYNNGTAIIQRNREQIQAPVNIVDIPPDRFSKELTTLPADAKAFFDEAVERSNKVVVLWPKSGWAEDATLLLGKAHYLRGQSNDWYDAKNRLEVFLTRYPDSKRTDEAKLWYGKTLLKLGEIDEAEENFRQITETNELSETVTEANVWLGDIAFEDKDYAAAGEHYVKASELKGGAKLKKSALYKSFYTYYRIHDYQKAIGYLNILLKTDLERAERFDMLFMKARTLKAAGQYKESIKILNDLIENLKYKNYFIVAEFEIADVLRLAGRNAEAVKQFEYVIDNYKNALISGDCYYFLGQIYDQPVPGRGAFEANRELAKKYYYLVKTKYGNANYSKAASERFDFMTRMDFFKGSIITDEILLSVIQKKIDDGDFMINMEEYFPSAMDNAVDTLTEKGNKEKTGAGDNAKSSVQKEIASVKIVSAELDEKKQQMENELLELSLLKDPDTLKIKKNSAFDRLAYDYVLLADYFYFDLSNYDSAAYYYQFVIDRYSTSSNVEFAWYGRARVQYKKNDPDYLSYYRRAMEAFPNGRFLDIGRKALALAEELTDSVSIYCRLAEENFLKTGNYDRAAEQYMRVALMDSSDRKLQAMYSLGLLYENKLDRAGDAFRMYNTLVYAGPNSDYARKIKPKVDAYAKEEGITNDSLKSLIDTNFVKIPYISSKTESDKSGAAEKKKDIPAFESAKSRLPEGLLPLEQDERMPSGVDIQKNEKKKIKKPADDDTEKKLEIKKDENDVPEE